MSDIFKLYFKTSEKFYKYEISLNSKFHKINRHYSIFNSRYPVSSAHVSCVIVVYDMNAVTLQGKIVSNHKWSLDTNGRKAEEHHPIPGLNNAFKRPRHDVVDHEF